MSTSASHPHSQLIESFYRAFQKRDAGAMWRMLCKRATTLEVEFSDVYADDRTGRAHWDARYDFSATGRKVFNRIDARFEFEDGKIIRHTDTFDLWKWAGMALGPTGKVLGWLPPLQNAIRKRALAGLDEFEARSA